MPETLTGTLYLTRLTLDDRQPRVLRAIGDVSELHRFVYTGFRSDLPKHDGTEVVRAELSDKARILYRLELPYIFVQSPERPDYPLGNGVLRAETQEFAPQISAGDTLFFQLRATPTVKKRFGEEYARPGHRRVPVVGADAQEQWLRDQIEGDDKTRLGIGAKLLSCRVNGSARSIGTRTSAPVSGRTMTHSGVDFEGTLCVNDPATFLSSFTKGVGAGKAWGFGMLMIKR